MALLASRASGFEFFAYGEEQLMMRQKTTLSSVPKLPWIHHTSQFAQSGVLQVGILIVSVLYHLFRQHRGLPAAKPNSRAFSISWQYELLSQTMRAISVASLAFAYTTDGVHILDVIVLAYAFILGLLRLINILRWRHVVLHQINFILTAMLLVLSLQLLPCIQIGTQCVRHCSVIGGAAALAITVFVAMATPREAVLRDTEFDIPGCAPNSSPAPDETCSWLSYFCTYQWLAPIIWKGTMKKLDISGIPGLVWSAEPLYLLHRLQKAREMSATTLSAILRFQRRELILMTLCIVACYVMENVAPYGMFKLLEYIGDPEKAVYHPWIWLCLVFFGPIFRSVLFQQYALTSRRLSLSIKSAMIQDLYHTALASIESVDDSFGLKGGGEQNQNQQAKAAKKITSEGRLVNLMAADVDAIFKGRDIIMVVAGVPIGTIIAFIGIYRMLGWASLVGTGVLLLFIPISTWLGKILYRGQKGVRKAQDSRISLVAEYLASIRVIKYFAWEGVVTDNILDARSVEQNELWRVAILQSVIDLVSQSLPILGLLAMFGIHAGINKEPLDASTTFTTVFLVNNIRSNMMFVSALFRNFTGAIASLERLDNYFKNAVPPAQYPIGPLRMKNAYFRRNQKNSFRLVNISIEFVERGLNVVTGQSGSGKSSLLLAILGETHWEGGNLTVPEDISFVPQSLWLQNQTIRDNILFGNPMEQVRYDRIIESCCLSPDFEMLPGQDMTAVGENGELLSGGQRARVSLARALYSKAPLLLLDDIFSALDAKTSEAVWRTCFCSDLLKGRTVVLVTQVPWVSSQADLAIHLHQGQVQSVEPNIGIIRKPFKIADVASGDTCSTIESTAETRTSNPSALQSLRKVPLQATNDAMSVAESQSSQGEVNQEMKASGKISRWISLEYVRYWGHSLLVIFCLVTLLLSNALLIASSLWLSKWVEAYKNTSSVNIAFFLGIYALLSFLGLTISGLSAIQFEWGAWRAARKLHDDLICAIMRVPLSWFIAVPVGRITNRLSGDMASIDGVLSAMLRAALTAAVTLCFRIGAVSSIIPQFMVPAIFACFFGVVIGEMFTRTALVLRRLTSSAQSPVFSQFASTLAGLAVIRAGAGKPQAFKNELAAKIRVWSAITDVNYNCSRWLAVRVDFISALVALSAGIIALYSGGMIGAGLVGFSLTNANSLSLNVLILVRTMNDLEVELQSFHRVKEYAKLSPEEEEEDECYHMEAENAPHDDVPNVPDNWPTSGNIEFRNVTIRYDLDGPDVLTDVNLKFESGERVAIVGRTGSGKSTILASLLRFTHVVSGQILYDGIDVTKVPRRRLRESLAIIPQEALLFNGSVESNLDPSGRIPLDKLERVLESCAGIESFSGRKDPFSKPAGNSEDASCNLHNSGIKLGTMVDARGTNFSHGQRQVLSLCRALARENKVMLLDEATASMDYETDCAIQQILRQEVDLAGGGQTIVTIAHRLRTIIDYDKVVVMSMGRVVECGSPKELYHARGAFYSMVLHSGEPAALQGALKKERAKIAIVESMDDDNSRFKMGL